MSSSIGMASEPQTAINSPSFERTKTSNTIPKRSLYKLPILAPSPLRPFNSEAIQDEWILREQLKYFSGIYSNIVNYENECIAIVDGQITPTLNNSPTQPKDGQLQTLYDIQCNLLYEYDIFIRNSQHPDAHSTIHDSTLSLSMLERMWKNSVERFLAFLLLRSPASLVHMLNFTNIVYWTLIRLYKEVPDFKDTWTTYLGYIAYFRAIMIPPSPVNTIIEIEDRSTWKQIAYNWYLLLYNESPSTGEILFSSWTARWIRSTTIDVLFHKIYLHCSAHPFYMEPIPGRIPQVYQFSID